VEVLLRVILVFDLDKPEFRRSLPNKDLDKRYKGWVSHEIVQQSARAKKDMGVEITGVVSKSEVVFTGDFN